VTLQAGSSIASCTILVADVTVMRSDRTLQVMGWWWQSLSTPHRNTV